MVMNHGQYIILKNEGTNNNNDIKPQAAHLKEKNQENSKKRELDTWDIAVKHAGQGRKSDFMP
jgi:hypothetical protein